MSLPLSEPISTFISSCASASSPSFRLSPLLRFNQLAQALLGPLLRFRQLLDHARQRKELIREKDTPQLGPPARSLLEKRYEIVEVVNRERHKLRTRL
jgi:hypothetical protein